MEDQQHACEHQHRALAPPAGLGRWTRCQPNRSNITKVSNIQVKVARVGWNGRREREVRGKEKELGGTPFRDTPDHRPPVWQSLPSRHPGGWLGCGPSQLEGGRETEKLGQVSPMLRQTSEVQDRESRIALPSPRPPIDAPSPGRDCGRRSPASASLPPPYMAGVVTTDRAPM